MDDSSIQARHRCLFGWLSSKYGTLLICFFDLAWMAVLFYRWIFQAITKTGNNSFGKNADMTRWQIPAFSIYWSLFGLSVVGIICIVCALISLIKESSCCLLPYLLWRILMTWVAFAIVALAGYALAVLTPWSVEIFELICEVSLRGHTPDPDQDKWNTRICLIVLLLAGVLFLTLFLWYTIIVFDAYQHFREVRKLENSHHLNSSKAINAYGSLESLKEMSRRPIKASVSEYLEDGDRIYG